MKKALSLILSIVIVVSTIACVDLSAYASDVNISNRAEWLSKLVEIFDMTVESDDYPDNYFSDLTEGSKYYRDILVATEYGLISVEAGEPIYPEDDITREFAAQTLNACLGFQLETNEDGEYEYIFADVEECSFPDDDQIAFNRGWFELVDGNFCPGNVVTATEITAMLDDAKAQIEFTTVDEDYDSRVEVADDVVEIPNGTELSIDENGTITIVDCPVTINESDSFTAYFYNLPNAYVAQSVTVDGNRTIITTQEANAEEVFENVDIQEVSQIDDAEFIPADGFTVEPDDSQSSTFALSRSSKAENILNNMKVSGDITVDGIKLALSAKLSNPVLETKISNSKTYNALNTDVDLSYSVSTKKDLVPKNLKPITIGYINILGVGYFKVSFVITLSGGITIKEKFNLTMGESYAEGEDLRIIADFTHKDFSITVEASLKVGIKLELGISIAIVKADVYASVGFAVKGTLTGYPSGTPSTCLNISGYKYLDIGAELTINYFFNSLHFGVEKAIIDSKNSPIKFAFHFEDGSKVHKCTRGNTPKYLTPDDSKHSDSTNGYADVTTGVDSSSFKYSTYYGDAKITKYTGSSATVVIPEYINGYKVVSIGNNAFETCINLTSVTIPDSVTSIGRFAFHECTSLTSVTIPDSVTSIGDRAFCCCTSLTSVTIPDSVTRIDNFTFSDCESLTSVKIPNSVTSIGGSAFSDCTSLTRVTIPDSVTSIGEGAFDECTSLTSVKIPNSVTSIGGLAFAGCSSLTNITIPDSVTSIGYGVFSGCRSLTSVIIPDSVTSIDNGAFQNCTSLTSFTIPDSVTSIGDRAFIDVNNIVYNGTASGSPWGAKAVNGYVDGYLVYSDSTKQELLGCSAQAISVTIPNSVTSIRQYAFSECTSLTSVTIGNSVTSIGEGAFNECTSLTSVTISDSVKRIGNYAFDLCESLTDVYYTGTQEEWYDIIIGSYNQYLIYANIHYKEHTHTYKTITTKATTSKNGSVVTKCTVCGTVKSKSTIYYPKTVTLSATSYTYDGKVKKPTLKVVGSNGKTISSANYMVSYASGRKNVGKYAVKITFKGNYSGTKTLYFTIKPKGTSISSVSAKSKGFTVKWKKQATQTTGYQIQYSTSSKFTNAKTVTVGKNSTTSKTISKLSAKKKYYVRIRTYKSVGKAKYYSVWSKAKTVITKK